MLKWIVFVMGFGIIGEIQMSLLNIKMEKINAKEYYSDEIYRVLYMGIPAACVINLPRMGMSPELGSGSYTDIILYFPYFNKVLVYEYTVDMLKHQVIIKEIAKVGTGDEYYKKGVKVYNYALGLTPFLTLHSGGVPDNEFEGKFTINCASVGVAGVEIRALYQREDRNSEWIDLTYFEGASSPDDLTPIAKWTQSRKAHALLWKTKIGRGFKKNEKLFHIHKYFGGD